MVQFVCLVVGQTVRLELFGRKITGHMHGDFLEAQFQGGLVPRVAGDDHAVLVHHNRLAEPKLLERPGHRFDRPVVAPLSERFVISLVNQLAAKKTTTKKAKQKRSQAKTGGPKDREGPQGLQEGRETFGLGGGASVPFRWGTEWLCFGRGGP